MPKKCGKCGSNKGGKGKICFACKDLEYKNYVGELKPLKSIKNPCFFCKKELDGEVITVKVRNSFFKKMHKSCNTKRLKEINNRKWRVKNPLQGGTGSKK